MERKPRIIFFEDDPHIRKMVKLLAKSNGYEIFTYENPTLCPIQQSQVCQCREKEACADFVITDIDMPHVSGLDFIEEQIKKDAKSKTLRSYPVSGQMRA